MTLLIKWKRVPETCPKKSKTWRDGDQETKPSELYVAKQTSCLILTLYNYIIIQYHECVNIGEHDLSSHMSNLWKVLVRMVVVCID